MKNKTLIIMVSYLELQERVYEKLSEWRESNGWHFSLRKQGRKNARTNRFIGKEERNYFGTTFWKSQNQYGGQPAGLVTLVFVITANGATYKFEFRHSTSAEGKQNELAAAFVRELQNRGDGIWSRSENSTPGNSVLMVTVPAPQEEYTSSAEMLRDLEQDLKQFVAQLDTFVVDFTERNPGFDIRRLTEEDTEIYESSYARRIAKYSNERSGLESAPEALSVDQWIKLLSDAEVFLPYDLKVINAFYHSPGHQNTTWAVDGMIQGLVANDSQTVRVNGAVARLAQRIDPLLDKPFEYIVRKDDSTCYWSMLFNGEQKGKYYVWELVPNLVTAFEAYGPGVKPEMPPIAKTEAMPDAALNQILYGPPGTGKTYATIEMGVRIANPDFTDFGDREALHTEFRRLKEVRRIAFTTFHQSLSYEDFVEGLKPKLDEGTEEDVSYEIKTGIFREICTDAAYEIYQSGQNAGKKVELDYGDRFEAYIAHVQEMLDNDQLVQLTTKAGRGAEITGITDRGNILIKHDNGERTYTISKDRQVRLDEGIPDFSNIEGNIYTVFRTIIGGSNASMHWAVMNAVRNFTPPVAEETQVIPSLKAKSKAIRGMGHEDYSSFDAPNHVLIIDEINRGNVSAILGELITLLEPDKRLGAREALTVTLPYSREEFGVPPNLYLIGTMNTADRSVEALDAALRRRFTFKEIAPNPQVIRDVHETQGIIPVDGMEKPVDLAHLLALLNRRIKALKDADHQIGHSYFLRVNDWKGLASAFNDRIIPLLREYFFANYGQLQLVVGKGFCTVDAAGTIDFAEADEEVDDYAGDYKSYHFPAPATEAELATALRQLGLS